MPCSSEGLVDIAGGEVRDYTVTHAYTPKAGVFKPVDLKQLVRCIQLAEGENRKIKAQGSGYSLSRAAVADDYLICTDKLNKWLSLPIPHSPKDTNPSWFPNAENRHHLSSLVRPSILSSLAEDAFLVHVEAGIKIQTLLAQLDEVGLALPTMGAGGGQSLAGAMSTGTHGSDFLLRPLSDFVRAIHLVGPGGQEWWIEPSIGFANGANLADLPGWCPDTKVVRDDDWFHAPIVSVGRCGVIYAVVLEVTKQFKLLDQTDMGVLWSDTRKNLNNSPVAIHRDGPVFGGVFRKESPEQDGEALRFFQVTVDLAKGEKCWVTRRWKTKRADETKDISKSTPQTFDGILCSSPKAFVGMLVALQGLPELGLLKAGLSPLLPLGPGWVVAIDAFFVELIAFAAHSVNGGEFLAKVAERTNRLSEIEVGPAATLLRDLALRASAWVIGFSHTEEKWGFSHDIVDGHPDKRRGCISAHSAEFFFDASTPKYIDFVDKILELSKAQGVPGYASLRFTAQSNCLLAMERFPLTVAIEIAVPRRLTETGDLFESFTNAMHAEAKKRGGIPHWGQRHDLKPEDVQTLYGEALERWRYVLAEIQGHSPSFSTVFSRNRGLEVLDSQMVDRVRTERDAGAFVSSLVPVYLSSMPFPMG